MAAHSSTLAWKIPWTEEPGGLQSVMLLRVGQDWATSLSCIGGGNGNPLQCSCLENPRDRGAWWAAIYGVAQSWTDWSDLAAAAAAAGLPVPNPSQHQGLSDSMDMSLSTLRELVMDREVWCAAIGWSQSRTRLSDWTELNWTEVSLFSSLLVSSVLCNTMRVQITICPHLPNQEFPKKGCPFRICLWVPVCCVMISTIFYCFSSCVFIL